jgi:hypothetical protein
MARLVLPVVEANQQERREAGQLPEGEEHEDVVAAHHAEHGGHEGKERRLEAPGIAVRAEVVRAIDDDARADHRDEQGEQDTQPVEAERQPQAQRRRPLEAARDRGARRHGGEGGEEVDCRGCGPRREQ